MFSEIVGQVFVLITFSTPFQYVAKDNNELLQRAIPKQTPVLTIVDERDDSVVRQVQQIPTIDPGVPDLVPQWQDATGEAVAQPATSALKSTTGKTAAQTNSVPGAVANTEEIPHVQVETDEAREARLDRQWKELKVDLAELPDVYARLAKIKLTGTAHEEPLLIL